LPRKTPIWRPNTGYETAQNTAKDTARSGARHNCGLA
jgi:hypothetical protein